MPTLLPVSAVFAETINGLLHVNDKARISHLGKDIINLRKSLGADTNIQVVINGRAVTAMLNGNKLIEEKVQSMRKQNANTGISHYAMRNNNVIEDRLVEGASILQEGGVVTILSCSRKAIFT